MFLDDRKNDLFVRVISLDDIPTSPTGGSTQKFSYTIGLNSPLEFAIPSILLLTTLPSGGNSQNHPSESPVPLSGLLRSPKEHKRKHSAPHANPSLKLNPESTVPRGPNPSRDLIDPPEISMHDVPTRPRH